MDANTSGVGSCFLGGTIEGFSTGLQCDAGSVGIDFAADIENVTTTATVGSTFCGRFKLMNAVGNEYRASANGSLNRWYRYRQLNGEVDQEAYYHHRFMSYDATGSTDIFGVYRGPQSSSFISGGTPDPKFIVTMGVSGDEQGQRNFITLVGHSIFWDTESPQTRGLGTWALGDVCFNSAAAVGQPKGWVCTVAGSPGTWVSQGNL